MENYDDITKLYVPPYQLERLRRTGTCTAKKKKEKGSDDIRFVNINAVWHLPSHYPDQDCIIICKISCGRWSEKLQRIYSSDIKDWCKFCEEHKVQYWAYQYDVLPPFII